MKGNTNEAIILIEKALELTLMNSGIMKGTGAFEKIEDFDKAIEFYKKSLEINPNDEECLSDYIEHINSQFQQAFSVLKSLWMSMNQTRFLPYWKSIWFWLLGQKDEALHLFSKCLKENGEKK